MKRSPINKRKQKLFKIKIRIIKTSCKIIRNRVIESEFHIILQLYYFIVLSIYDTKSVYILVL